VLFTTQSFLIKELKHKSIIWFKVSNTYVLIAHDTVKILKKISEGFSKNELFTFCLQQFQFSNEQTETVLNAVYRLIDQFNAPINIETNSTTELFKIKNYDSTKFYKIGDKIIKVSFETSDLEFLVHPKFAHLEVEHTVNSISHFKVGYSQNNIVFEVDTERVGTWEEKEVHYFQGKFSMVLLETIYKIEEKKWMAVLHASAISNGKNCILFTGDSGNGKSTLAALLVANGYTLFADDFVPIAAATKNVYYFPAAISIKENAVATLLPLFPELEKACLYNYEKLHKKVRYLAAKRLNTNQKKQLPCKAIVLVNYKKNSDLIIKKLSKEDAFEYLVPDSWLSPEAENASIFLEWFSKMPCYQLTYSDTELMYKTVEELFSFCKNGNNEL